MRKIRIVMSLIFLAAIILSCGKREETVVEKTARAPVQGVKIETVKSIPVPEDYEAVGTVRSKTTTVLSSRTMGNILNVPIREGDRVRTGQLLIEIDDRDTKAQLQKAQAGLREVQDAQEEIEQTIRAAESARDAAEAGRSLALATFTRYKSLLDEKSVSRQEFDEVQAKLKVAEAEADRANRMLQALLAKKNQIHAKQEQVRADIASAQVYVGYGRILSPMDGIIISKQAEIGFLAAPGVPLLTIEDNSRYRLEVSVEDSLVGKIRLGTSAQVSIDALGLQEVTGRVTEVVPVSDPASRSLMVKIDLSQPALRSGLFGKARFSIGEKQVIQVPQKAILQQGQLVSVLVVDSSGTIHLRLIKTGRTYGDRTEVLSGINEGDRIIVEGLGKVKEGDRVQ